MMMLRVITMLDKAVVVQVKRGCEDVSQELSQSRKRDVQGYLDQ